MRTHRAAAFSRVVHIMNEIVCRRDEIGNTNEVPFVPGKNCPAIVTNRYNSLLVALLIVCRTGPTEGLSMKLTYWIPIRQGD
jgi:hypothetical protein